jgi:hypothetical protein
VCVTVFSDSCELVCFCLFVCCMKSGGVCVFVCCVPRVVLCMFVFV